MKISLFYLTVLIISVMFFGCTYPTYELEPELGPGPELLSWEEVTQPYLDEYGPQNAKHDYGRTVYWDWYYVEYNLRVTFVKLIGGWIVENERIWYDFLQISQPYLDEYGPPEEVNYSWDVRGDCYTEWIWGAQGFAVTFRYRGGRDMGDCIVWSTDPPEEK